MGDTVHPYMCPREGFRRVFLRIDPGSGVPIYRQIMDGVRYSVATGQIGRGDRLPSVRDLATSLGVNPTTIQKAYGELEHQGVVETRRGQGTFVREDAPDVSRRERATALGREIRVLLTRAHELGVGEAELLDLVRVALEAYEERRDED